MQTHFITLEVELQPSAQSLQAQILAQLRRQGEPLRWAIVAVDRERNIACIEAVITTPTEFLIPGAVVRTV
jgi:hypothetical protein